eukprot:TRINITY_DN65816_c2_g1_i1.p1 TRINITY_DN65816_c2_g1~~TRINITY_DN65816_c2_g1_i1.p1  ORF type:complete len:640 (-),score=61.45 TRINITY_DN65816_c2_g1_i1:1423-3276(-)
MADENERTTWYLHTNGCETEWKQSKITEDVVLFECVPAKQAFGISRAMCNGIGLYLNTQELDGCDCLPLLEGEPQHIKLLLEAEVLRHTAPFGRISTIKPLVLGNNWKTSLPDWFTDRFLCKTVTSQQLAKLICVANYLQCTMLLHILCAALAHCHPWDPKVFSEVGSTDILSLLVATVPQTLVPLQEHHKDEIELEVVVPRSLLLRDVALPWITLPMKAGRKPVLPDPGESEEPKPTFELVETMVSYLIYTLMNTTYHVNPTEMWWLYNLVYSVCIAKQEASYDVTGSSQQKLLQQLQNKLKKISATICKQCGVSKVQDGTEVSQALLEEIVNKVLKQYKRVVFPLTQCYGYLEDHFLKYVVDEEDPSLLKIAEAILKKDFPRVTLGKPLSSGALLAPQRLQRTTTSSEAEPAEKKRRTDGKSSASSSSSTAAGGENPGERDSISVLAVVQSDDNDLEGIRLSEGVWKGIPLLKECVEHRGHEQLCGGLLDEVYADKVVVLGMSVPADPFRQVVDFLEYHSDPKHPIPVIPKPLPQPLDQLLASQGFQWDRDWVFKRLIVDGDETKHELLISTVACANQLRVEPAMRLCSAAVASLIRGKTVDQIRTLFRMGQDDD